jgi:ATP-dependent helicase/nuclease subunit A
VGYRCGALRTRDWISADERYRRIQEDEERRLLYVALTRAKDRILLTGGRLDKGFLRMIVMALGDAGLEIRPDREQTLSTDGFEVNVRFRDRMEASWSPGAEPVTVTDSNYEIESRQWEARETERRKLAQVPLLRHPSASAPFHGEYPSEPRGEDLDRVHRLERDDERVDAMSVGSRCHDVLATVDLRQAASAVADEAVRAILEPFFKSEAFRDIQRAEAVHREVPFLIEFDGARWSGQIDVLYNLDGRWIVADYKSDRHERPEHYHTQARIYARAAQQALKLAKPPEFRLIYLRTGRVVQVS